MPNHKIKHFTTRLSEFNNINLIRIVNYFGGNKTKHLNIALTDYIIKKQKQKIKHGLLKFN